MSDQRKILGLINIIGPDVEILANAFAKAADTAGCLLVEPFLDETMEHLKTHMRIFQAGVSLPIFYNGNEGIYLKRTLLTSARNVFKEAGGLISGLSGEEAAGRFTVELFKLAQDQGVIKFNGIHATIV